MLDLLNAALAIYSSVGKEAEPDGQSPSDKDPDEAADSIPNGSVEQTNLYWRAEASACLTLAPVAYSQERPEIAAKLFDRAALRWRETIRR